METLTRVLKYGTSDFFNFIRNIDYGYMDVKEKFIEFHRMMIIQNKAVNPMFFLS